MVCLTTNISTSTRHGHLVFDRYRVVESESYHEKFQEVLSYFVGVMPSRKSISRVEVKLFRTGDKTTANIS